MSATAQTKDAPWVAIAARKRAARDALIPAEWRIDSSLLPKDPPKLEYGPQNVLDVPRKVLSKSEVEITESYTIRTLLAAIASRKLSAEETTRAFCHRTAVAQQLTNCLTEPLFEDAIKRAKELDSILEKTGKVFGPLHGLPVSVKDTFDIAGYDTSVGVASLCNKPAKESAPLVKLLLSLGCIIIAKTNVPQTLSSLDSINNVFGRTMNPVNRMTTAGGSSGGEGVIAVMKGSMIGIGTDIGGSIRVPAMCNGVYGFKPSNLVIPYGGQVLAGTAGMSMTSVQAVAGPIGRSMEDIDILLKEIVPRASLWGEDCMATPWGVNPDIKRGCGENGEFVVGVLRTDGNCSLLPPISNMLNEVAAKLRAAGVKVVELDTPKAWTKSQSVMSKLMGVDGGRVMGKLLQDTGEPLVPWMQTRFRTGKPQPLDRVAELQAQRAGLEREMLQLWSRQDDQGRKIRALDAIICPMAPHPTPPIEGYNAVGMTSSWVLFDYPAGNLPVRKVVEADLELGKPQGGKNLGSWDEKCRELWDETKTDRRVYLDTVLCLQVVTARGEDEKLCVAMDKIDQIVNGGGSAYNARAKL